MSLLYPTFLWLLIPLGMFWLFLRPRSLHAFVHMLILALLILALSRPQIEGGIRPETIQGREIIIALDVSYSMRAQDLSPDRYGYAKETIKALLAQNPKDRFMLIAFTTNPLLLSPPTSDHALVTTALEALDLDNILTKGTSLSKLLQKIVSFKKQAVEIVLITDGGEEHDLNKPSGILEKSNIRLHILATGSKAGATIPLPDGTLLKDKKGHLVISRINPLLARLARSTGGSYDLAEGTAAQSAARLSERFMQADTSAQKMRRMATELYFYPLLLAIVLFLMAHTRAARYLLLLFVLMGLPLEAGFFDGLSLQKAYARYNAADYNRTLEILAHIDTPSVQQRYAQASTLYRLGAYKEAIARYRSIRSTDAKLKQHLYYNIANAYAMLKAYDKARIYYTKVLQLGEDADALHNLSVVARLEAQKESLGIAHPKSQGAQSDTTGTLEEKSNENASKESSGGSGAGGGGEGTHKNTPQPPKRGKLLLDKESTPQPLSSKAYELINKGYIRETQPW